MCILPPEVLNCNPASKLPVWAYNWTECATFASGAEPVPIVITLVAESSKCVAAVGVTLLFNNKFEFVVTVNFWAPLPTWNEPAKALVAESSKCVAAVGSTKLFNNTFVLVVTVNFWLVAPHWNELANVFEKLYPIATPVPALDVTVYPIAIPP